MSETAAATGRSERRKQETMEKLLDAAYALVTERGVEETTLNRISEAADLSRRVIYIHFRDKEDCIIAAAARSFAAYASAAQQAMLDHTDPAWVIAWSTFDVFGGLIKDPILPQLLGYPEITAKALNSAIWDFVSSDVEAGVNSGRLSSPLPPDLLRHYLQWTMMCLAHDAYEAGAGSNEVLFAYAQSWLRILGISAEEARQISREVRNQRKDRA